MPVSVIIPSLNEAAHIGATIDAAFAAGAAEVIVADGGSVDATVAIAEARGARVIAGETIRARQLNRGAEAAAHDVLLFVHADTLLPAGAAEAVLRAVRQGFDFGGFHLAFLEHCTRLRLVAMMINARTRITRAPWGDQAQFVRRDVFRRLGGYPDFPIMEDYEFARRAGMRCFLPQSVRTSGRRFLAKGVLRTAMVNWLIIAAYHLGAKPETLARWYRGA